ncbi:MAG: outer membrane lipoprotein carrier protein LolA, partial [Myxococcales bacterium]|nr:outer membrane lipoprotein carrier protein LolA [Myxococcales bacterium]
VVVTREERDGGPAVGAGSLGFEVGTSTAGAIRVATAPTADEVVTEVQKFYGGITQVTAKFRQTVTNVTFGDTKSSDGTVWIKKPGKMRWDYYTKKGKKTATSKSFISNGDYLYVVEHDNKQVVEKNLEKNMLPVAVTFLYGKGDLKADFTAALDGSKKYGGKGDLVLKLTPKTESAQYKTLYLVVASDDYRVKESIIIDPAGNTNHFRFYEPDFKKAVKDSWFNFDPKTVKNYRIINADEEDAKDGADAKGDAPAKKTK